MKTFLRFLRRFASVLIVLAALAVLGVWMMARRATRLVNSLLRDFATQQAAQLSDSVYVLNVGTLHFNWQMRRVTLDSVILTTDANRNAARARPLATASVALRTCTLGGIDVPTLVRSKGLEATHFGCREVTVAVDQPAPPAEAAPARPAPAAAPRRAPRDTTRAAAGAVAAGAFLTFQQQLELPRQVPALRVGRIAFPNVAIDLRQRRPGGNDLAFDLARALLRVQDLVIANDDTMSAHRPLFSESVILTAAGTEVTPDTVNRIAVESLEVNLTDSLVLVRGASYGPQISDEEYRRLSPYRHDRIRLRAGRVAFIGLDFGAFSVTGAVLARRLEVDSFRFEIRTDKRLPRRPGPSIPKRSLQGYVGTRPREFRIDSVRVRDASIIYEEWAERRNAPGRLAFTDVDVTGSSFRHIPGRVSFADPFRIDMTALLLGQGRLRARFEVPLDAPGFTMLARGDLGPMPATAFNPFLSQIMPVEVKGGQVQGVSFRFAVENGRARGDLTPRYTGLDVNITGEGATGIVGNRGILGGIVRGAAELAAGLKVRMSNPGNPRDRPRTGAIDHTFRGESLPAFFWNTIKTGLLPVVVK